MNTDDELDKIFLGQHTDHAEEVCDTLYPENKDICTCWVAEAKQAIKAYTEGQLRTILISLIDDEIREYKIFSDDDKICVGIKLMADNVRDKYDQLKGEK
jgi:hypothetical protein